MSRAQTQPFAMSAVSQPAGAVRAVTRSLLARLARYWEARSAVRHLSEMSEWQLADIGLTRSDVDSVALNGARRLATRRLQEIAQERTRIAGAHGGADLRS
ncbi:DUF1127 domain-containing protein [Nitratireductor sp. GISD-1A_MAKvit]|uniref:DUF1127 domain-containing protein n=1 Tax=Nitratireductor sp. GISD-1A_MAKvit TaxID=3234198 RepID=UPI0034652357